MNWELLESYKLTEDEKNLIKRMTRQEMINELKQTVYGDVKAEDLDDNEVLDTMLEENFTYLCEWERD